MYEQACKKQQRGFHAEWRIYWISLKRYLNRCVCHFPLHLVCVCMPARANKCSIISICKHYSTIHVFTKFWSFYREQLSSAMIVPLQLGVRTVSLTYLECWILLLDEITTTWRTVQPRWIDVWLFSEKLMVSCRLWMYSQKLMVSCRIKRKWLCSQS